MWTFVDELRMCVRMGLRKGLKAVRATREFTEEERKRISSEIVSHLQLSNWKIEPGESAKGHGPGLMPKGGD
jgi:hypothetical protein